MLSELEGAVDAAGGHGAATEAAAMDAVRERADEFGDNPKTAARAPLLRIHMG